MHKMVNKVYENQKIALRFSKKAIDKAARDIRHNCSIDERNDAIEKIQNFREVHLYPLMLIKNHLARTAKKVDEKIIIARRLKRLPTIIDKLERPSLDGESQNAIKLTRMQDIGGCRAIVKNIEQLEILKSKLEASRSVHKIISTSDYLTPKASGYSGVHLVYSCFNNIEDDNNWKKTKIEVQLRTKLQHAWATSLEIIDTLKQINLKTSLSGHTSWRRFFSIAGKLVAHDEGAALLEPHIVLYYEIELEKLERELRALGSLTSFGVGIQATTEHLKKLPKKYKLGMCLVSISFESLLNPKLDNAGKKRINVAVEAFKSEESQEAIQALNEQEADNNIAISVLLSASDVTALYKAYPNYFGSTSDFVNFIRKHIKKHRVRTRVI